MTKQLLISACLVLAVAASVAASEPATLVLRSGERISGELVDMGGTDLTMQVDGRERRIPIDHVALIDFVGGGQGLPDTELSRIPGDGHIMFLRGGQHVVGWLTDIGGTRPLILRFSTDRGEREISSSEVGRIYLARLPRARAEIQPPAPDAGTEIVVPARQRWVSTGLFVRQGEMVAFAASGEIQLSNDPNDVATAAGAERSAPRAPRPRDLAGALIGRISGSEPFGIGDQTHPIPMPASGLLFLGINDDRLKDNLGEFRVRITRHGGGTETRRRR